MLRLLPEGFRPSLYVHLPFCSSKCAYCDFFSISAWDEGLAGRVLSQELAELAAYKRETGARAFDTLYVGGGTPSVLPRRLLEPFLLGLAAEAGGAFNEFTIEANPESLDADFLGAAKRAGVDRLSLGLQSFHDPYLARLGRRADSRDNRRALDLLSRSWNRKVSLDLMYGFPEEAQGEAVRDLEEILAFKPGHVSLYALTVEEATPLFRTVEEGKAADVDPDRQEALRDLLHERLLEAGYRNYEISNYAFPGEECRHNRSYWNLKPYVGLGPAGVSTLPAEAPQPAARLSGLRDLEAFSRADFSKPRIEDSGGVEVERIDAKAFLLDYLLMGLRTEDGIEEDAFRAVFGVSLRGLSAETLRRREEFFQTTPGRLALNDRGRRVLNSVLVDFFRELDGKEPPFSCVWPAMER